MPNHYRYPLALITFLERQPPGSWVAQFVGTEAVYDLPDGSILVRFNLLQLSAN